MKLFRENYTALLITLSVILLLAANAVLGVVLTSQSKHAMKKHGVTYFAAVGGAAALIAKSVKKYEVIAYPELGPEALAKLTVEDFPAIVVIDCEGNSLYETNQEKYRTLEGY